MAEDGSCFSYSYSAKRYSYSFAASLCLRGFEYEYRFAEYEYEYEQRPPHVYELGFGQSNWRAFSPVHLLSIQRLHVMQPLTAEVVELVFSRSWELRDTLRNATAADVESAQTELQELLARVAAAEVADGCRGFLGSTYPLVCWIDQLMTTDPRVARLWSGRELERQLFESDEREWMFWQQAKLAESLNRFDALEIFFLCVAHGFTGRRLKGEPADRAETLRGWMERMRAPVARVPELDLPCESHFAPPPDVPPLQGRRAMRSMLAVGWIASIILLPMLSYWGARNWMLS